MRKIVSAAFASTAALALSACGTAEDASVEAEAENVEVPAEIAVEEIEEAPVADPMVGETSDTMPAAEAPVVNAAEADRAGANAEAAAADVMAAAKEAGTDAARKKGNEMVDKAADAAKKQLGN